MIAFTITLVILMKERSTMAYLNYISEPYGWLSYHGLLGGGRIENACGDSTGHPRAPLGLGGAYWGDLGRSWGSPREVLG